MNAVGALVARDYRITRSYRLAFAMDLLYGVVEVAIYYFISKTFAATPSAELGGAPSYFAFATVGIIITLVVASASNGIAQRLREEQLAGTLEALTMQPIRTTELALGLAGFPCLFAFFRAATYVFFATVVFGLDFHGGSVPGVVLVLLATATAMLGLGILVAALTVLFKRGGTFASVAIFGMGVLSGAVFPVSVLPGWLRPIADILPTKLAARYSECAVSWLDGVSVDCETWHFNVRPSNTEPLLRLNLEAFSKEEMEARTEEILNIIRS